MNYLPLCLLLALVSCQVGSRYQEPEIPIPNEWHSSLSENMNFKDPEKFVWWESLNDSLLNSLIQRAAEKNLDLFIAGTRILEVRAEKQGKMAEFYPHIDGSLTTGHVYYSKNALVHGILDAVCPSHRRRSVKRNVNFFEVGFDANWEIDLFGANQYAMRALQAKIESTSESLCDLWVTLSAEVARNYVELRSLQQRIKLLDRQMEIQQETIHLTHELFKIEIASSFDILKTEEQLVTLSAQKPLLEVGVDKAIHRISVLLGEFPEELFRELSITQELPQIPCEQPIGIPSELLRRRPDIRKAERNLAAATESVSSAVAELFPRLSLSGFIGSISTQLSSLVHSSSFTWFAAPQLLFPIFNSSLITQDIDFNKIKAQQALFEYQQVVLNALEEVENGITSFHQEEKHHDYLNQVYQTRQSAYQLSFDLYQRGIQDYLEVLESSRSILSAQESINQSQADLLLDYIALYKALGGGWRITPTNETSCQ